MIAVTKPRRIPGRPKMERLMVIDEKTAEDLIQALGRGDYRLLKKVAVEEQPSEHVDLNGTSVAAIVDVETSGLDPAEDAITELAIRRFRFDAEGKVVKIDRLHSWLEDPLRPLPDDIVKLTGITQEMVAGQRIDEETASKLLGSADVIISHNAAFDRPFVDARLPSVRGLPWACSCEGVAWKTFGFDGRSLGWLLAQHGWFHDAHRAAADVDGLVTLLKEEICPEFTVLRVLMEHERQPSCIVRAVGAHFDIKDRLKARGYRWDAGRKVWFRNVFQDDLEAEQLWLQTWVYAANCWPRAAGPDLEEVNWQQRYTRAT